MNIFYADLYKQQAASDASGGSMSFPEIVAGQTVQYAIRFLGWAGSYYEQDQELAALKVSIGNRDARPTSGKYKIKIGSGVQTEYNTTTDLEWNSKPSAVAASLNAVPNGSGDYTVDEDRGSYLIRRAGGQEMLIAIVNNRLNPTSTGRITATETDGEFVYSLRLTQMPVVFSDSALRKNPESPAIKSVQDGGMDFSGTTLWPEIQKLQIPTNFRGTYQLRRGYAKTRLLDITDGPDQIQDELNTILAPEGGSVIVTNPTNNEAHITFGGDLLGFNLDLLVVQVYSAPPGDWTFDLDCNSASLWSALRDKETITLPFEGEAEIYVNPDNLSEGTRTVKLWSKEVTIRRPLIWPDLQAVPEIDWLYQNPQDYTPFTPDQIVTGPQTYSVVIGTGTATTFEITHGLATSNIANIVVRANTAAWTQKVEGVDYSAELSGDNIVSLTFSAAPALNSLIVYVTAAASDRDWEPHHHTIAQIDTLQASLDDFGSRILRLEALIGRPDVGTTTVVSGNKKSEYSFPNIGEILPDIINEDVSATIASQVSANTTTSVAVTIPNTELEKERAEQLAEIERLKAEAAAIAAQNRRNSDDEAARIAAKIVPSKTTSNICRVTYPAISTQFPTLRTGGKLPWLLPAINDAEPTEASALPSSPVAGSLYAATASFALPGGGGRKMQNVTSGDRFGYDGRCLYRVVENGDSWSALEMERELLRSILRAEQFPSGSDLSLSWTITSSLICDQLDATARDIARTVDGAQYILVAEAIPIPDASSPGSPGLNLGMEGNATRLFAKRITLSPAIEEHSYSMSLNRNTSGVGTGTITNYGSEEAIASIPAGAFVLRLRLTAFDVDDTSEDPRGQIKLEMPSCQLQVTLTR